MAKYYLQNNGKNIATAETLKEAQAKIFEFVENGVKGMIYVTASPKPTCWKPTKQELEG